jgi:hypothetical protein
LGDIELSKDRYFRQAKIAQMGVDKKDRIWYAIIQHQAVSIGRLRLVWLPPGRMSDKVWGAIPMPAVLAKEANLLAVYHGQRFRLLSLIARKEVIYWLLDRNAHSDPY